MSAAKEQLADALRDRSQTITDLLGYVQHKWNCDWLQVNWHKGPCDCGLKELIKSLPEDLLAVLVEASEHVRCTVEDMKVQAERERAAKENPP